MIDVCQDLLAHGRLVPLHPGEKRPWIRSVIKGASSDPTKVAAWQKSKPDCNWGFRIESDSLIVLDLERPGKGSLCGGARSIDWAEMDEGQRLSDSPVATTVSGGEHRYFRLPVAYRGRIRNWTAVLPGVDVRVRGGMVVIPPSTGRMWIESFDDVDLPELPEWFCELILAGRAQPTTHTIQTETTSGKGGQDQVVFVPHFPGAGIKKNQWFTLFHSKEFIQVWHRTHTMPRDNSQSSFEFSLAMRALGLEWSRDQVVTLLRCWWKAQGLAGDEKRLVMRILPDAYQASMPFRVGREQDAQEEKAAKTAGKTRTRILGWIRIHGASTPVQVSEGIGISRAAAKMQLHRLASSGILLHEHQAYSVPLNTPNTEPVIYPHFVTGPSRATTPNPPAIELQPAFEEAA